MQVICIDAKKRVQNCDLVEGNIYEVTHQNWCGRGCCYKIAGSIAWKKDRFIPLSDIDETELLTERVEQYETVSSTVH